MKNKKYSLLLLPGLALCVLAVSVIIIQSVLPNYKGVITAFPKGEKDSLIYIAKSDDWTVYPWDIFNPSKCVEADTVGSLSSDELEKILLLTLINYQPKAPGDFRPKILFNIEQNMFFVNDYEFTDIYDEQCLVNIAVKDDQIIYLHCIEKDAPPLATENISDAEQKLNKLIWNSYISNNIGGIISGSETTSKYVYSDNPFDIFYFRIIDEPRSLYFFQYFDIYQNPEIYKNYMAVSDGKEILVIFTLEGKTLILFYNPVADKITGYSVK